MATKNKSTANTPVATDAKQPPVKHVPFIVVEAYKTIRTNIMFLLAQNNGHVIAFSSSNAGEGKSTTSINVAIAFSQLGGKVLLIDADMRRSSIHKKLKFDNANGLSNVIAGFSSLEDSVKTFNDNLDVLTAGPTPPNPSELLGSAALEKLISELRDKYDYIIIDTPPVNVVSDALIVTPKTDGLILVVRAGYTPHDSLQRTLSAAKFANINVLGSVMNGTGMNRNHYYKYRKYKYSKYNDYNGYNYKYDRKPY